MSISNLFKRSTRLLAIPLFGLALFGAGPALAQSAVTEREQQGMIQEIERDTNRVIIDGVRYRVAIDAAVEIRGARSAFALLREGMKVHFGYRDFGDALEIYLIEQLPDNTTLEEV
ncbi:MAG: hypothetical protein R3E82_02905 [Pseudomonadales bacterium]